MSTTKRIILIVGAIRMLSTMTAVSEFAVSIVIARQHLTSNVSICMQICALFTAFFMAGRSQCMHFQLQSRMKSPTSDYVLPGPPAAYSLTWKKIQKSYKM